MATSSNLKSMIHIQDAVRSIWFYNPESKIERIIQVKLLITALTGCKLSHLNSTSILENGIIWLRSRDRNNVSFNPIPLPILLLEKIDKLDIKWSEISGFNAPTWTFLSFIKKVTKKSTKTCSLEELPLFSFHFRSEVKDLIQLQLQIRKEQDLDGTKTKYLLSRMASLKNWNFEIVFETQKDLSNI